MQRRRHRPTMIIASLVLALLTATGIALAAEGDLDFIGCVEDTGSPAGCDDQGGAIDGLDGAYRVAISPDGKHAYVGSQADDSLVAFSRNPNSGALEFVETETDGVGGVDSLTGATGVSISPDGSHVYLASWFENSVTAFVRNPNSGTLDEVDVETEGVDGVNGLDGALEVATSPDGKHVYVASFIDDSVAAFERSPATGALEFVEFEKDGVGGVDGLNRAEAVTISPDGKHVYVVGNVDDAVAAFSRDASDGTLDFVEFEKDGVGGVDGLDGVRGVSTSADGGSVYTVSADDKSIAAFARDEGTGELDFVEFEKQGVGGVTGLTTPSDVTVSADDKHVYVAAETLAAFARNPVSGALEFSGSKQDGVGGVDGLAGAVGVAVSPGDRHLYVAASSDDAVSVFAREADLSPPETTIDSGPGSSTDDNTPTFAFSSDDPLFTAGFECRVDTGLWDECASPYTSFALADGPHRFRVRAIDTAANTDDTPAESLFTVDTTPPDPADTTPPDTELTDEPDAVLTIKVKKKGKKRSRAQAARKGARASFGFVSSEPGSSFECKLDGGSYAPCGSPVNLKLGKGSHRFKVRAIDAAGNRDFSAAKWSGEVRLIKKR